MATGQIELLINVIHPTVIPLVPHQHIPEPVISGGVKASFFQMFEKNKVNYTKVSLPGERLFIVVLLYTEWRGRIKS